MHALLSPSILYLAVQDASAHMSLPFPHVQRLSASLQAAVSMQQEISKAAVCCQALKAIPTRLPRRSEHTCQPSHQQNSGLARLVFINLQASSCFPYWHRPEHQPSCCSKAQGQHAFAAKHSCFWARRARTQLASCCRRVCLASGCCRIILCSG